VAQALARLRQTEADLPDRAEHALPFPRIDDHVPILPYDRGVDEPARYLVYSITKTYLGVLCLRLGLDLDAPIAAWIDDPRLPDASLRQLLSHTSGVPDYGRLPDYRAAVRERPSEPWDDEELLARALAQGPDFPPGDGWAYSNTGFLLVRQIVELVAEGGFPGALERELLQPLRLADTALALELADLQGLAPGPSGTDDVRGRYHPCWVGHRTLASTVADQTRFWSALAAGELCDLDLLTESVEIGFDAPGFHRPSYGLGVMTDPRPDGLVIGHGGGGPGYAAAAFALLRPQAEPRVIVILSADERADVQREALSRL
jgi:D-alanyl-D-alanine carboxypeptidase